MLLPAEDASMALTVGDGGETILWQARKLRDHTALMQALAIYKPKDRLLPFKGAISADGKRAVLVTTESVILLALEKRKLVEQNIMLSQFPLANDILSLNFDNSNAGELFLVAVDSSSAVSVWRVDDNSAHLLCQTALSVPAVRAVMTPQTASSAARIACTDSEDCIRLGSLLLERDRASYCELISLKPQVSKISLLCCSTTNYIACVGSTSGNMQLHIINTQSSLFTTGLEYSLQLKCAIVLFAKVDHII